MSVFIILKNSLRTIIMRKRSILIAETAIDRLQQLYTYAAGVTGIANIMNPQIPKSHTKN